MESKTIKKIKHFVYDTIDEFRQHHKDTDVKKEWKTASEGDWVYSDDNRIIQLLRVSNRIKHPNDRKNYTHSRGWVRTVVGPFLKNYKSKMYTSFEKHPKIYHLAQKSRILIIGLKKE